MKSDSTDIYEPVSTLDHIIKKMCNTCSVQNHGYNNSFTQDLYTYCILTNTVLGQQSRTMAHGPNPVHGLLLYGL